MGWEITHLYKAFARTYYVSYQYTLRTLWRVSAFCNVCCSNSYLAFVLPVSVWLGLPLWKRNRSWMALPCYSVTCNWSFFTFSFQAWAVALPPFLLVSTSSRPSRSITSLSILMKTLLFPMYRTRDSQRFVSLVKVCDVLSHISCVRLCDPMDCSPPGSTVHGMLQAILEWVVMPSFRESSLTQGLNLHLSPALAGRFSTTSATWEGVLYLQPIRSFKQHVFLWLTKLYTLLHCTEKHLSEETFPAGSLKRGQSLDGLWLVLLLPFNVVFDKLPKAEILLIKRRNWTHVRCLEKKKQPSNGQIFFSTWGGCAHCCGGTAPETTGQHGSFWPRALGTRSWGLTKEPKESLHLQGRELKL